MKRRAIAIVAMTLGVGLVIPLARPASAVGVVVDDVNDNINADITSLIVERLPGRSTLAALSTVEALTDADATRGTRLGDRFETIVLDEPVSVDEAEELASTLERDGVVASASPDYPRYSTAAPNDPEWPNQWALQTFNGATNAGIGVEGAWSAAPGTNDVVVAVIDTGRPRYLGSDHPDMVGNVVAGYDFMSLSNSGRNPRDGDGWDANETDEGDWETTGQCGTNSSAFPSSWHGSHVAGIIGAESNNGIGIAGINPRAKIQHIRILGSCGGVTSDEIVAIRWAAGVEIPPDLLNGNSAPPINPTPAKVINLSLGGESPCTDAEQHAINDAVNHGSIVVVAAGNSNLDLDLHDYAPANCDNVLTVAATTQNGSKLSQSNYGSTVEIAAPGSAIKSTLNDGATTTSASWSYASKSGTSMAAPIVSGVVSLMLSYRPTLTFVDVRHILQQTASAFPAGSNCSSNPADTFFCGDGIVNATNALQALPDYSPRGALVDLTPNRVLDTRDGTGGVPRERVGNFSGTATDLRFRILGAGGVPNLGVAAVSMSVTATETAAPDEGGYVTVYPCATGRPTVSNINFTNRQIVPNAVIVPVGDGDICFHVYGTAHLIVDVYGWLPFGAGFTTVTPNRVLDTRNGVGVVSVARVGDFTGTAADLPFTILGADSVPTTGVAAVSLNLTVSNASAPDAGGYVTVYPCATGEPGVSNLNFVDGQIVANAVIVPVDNSGRICFHVYGIAHVIVDVNGWFASGAGFTPVAPSRVMDTRDGTGPVAAARVGNFLGTASDLAFTVVGTGGIPAVGVSAVSVNVTAAETSAPDVGGFVTVYPCAVGRTNVSNINFRAGQIVANAVTVPVDENGRICLHVYGIAHLIIDVNGWFPGDTP
jgi:subtilisin family serine protease